MPHLRRRFWIAPLVLMVVVAAPSLSGAGKWKVTDEAKPLYYKMKSTTYSRRGDVKTVVFEIDVKNANTTGEPGSEKMFVVRTTQEHTMPARRLRGMQLAYGAMQLGAISVAGAHWAAYQGLLGQLELTVGEKMSYFGGMLAKVTAKETIAGHEGFVVQMFNTSKDEPVLMAELVLHPDIPVALRTRSYRKGKVQQETVLLKYEAR